MNSLKNLKPFQKGKLNWLKTEERNILKGKRMDDLEKYIQKRKQKSEKFTQSFELGYENFKIGVLLQQIRKEAGLTQEQVAKQLNPKKTAISRIENHAEDIRLSTLEKYIDALGKKLQFTII